MSRKQLASLDWSVEMKEENRLFQVGSEWKQQNAPAASLPPSYIKSSCVFRWTLLSQQADEGLFGGYPIEWEEPKPIYCCPSAS